MVLVGVATAWGRSRVALLFVVLLAAVWSGATTPLAEDEPCVSALEVLLRGDGTECDYDARENSGALISVLTDMDCGPKPSYSQMLLRT